MPDYVLPDYVFAFSICLQYSFLFFNGTVILSCCVGLAL
jgi:hypothetical protein